MCDSSVKLTVINLPQLRIFRVFNICGFYKTLSDMKMQETMSLTNMQAMQLSHSLIPSQLVGPLPEKMKGPGDMVAQILGLLGFI